MTNRSATSSNIFQAVADPTRRAILGHLKLSDQSAGFLCAQFAISQPAVSQHLRVLLDAGLVSERRDGRRRLYKLEPAPLKEVDDWVKEYEHFWEEKLDALGDYLDRKKNKR
ncbi:MAG: metalloregulator ArsR/SmtB family transcription factor [Acidobacteriota bacterium]